LLKANDWCKSALLALAVKNPIFLPTFAILATIQKYPGNNGDKISNKVIPSIDNAETILYRFGSLSIA
jgi:hypothetical protein